MARRERLGGHAEAVSDADSELSALQSTLTKLNKTIATMQMVEAARQRFCKTLLGVTAVMRRGYPALTVSSAVVASMVWDAAVAGKAMQARCVGQVLMAVSGIYHPALIDWLQYGLPSSLDRHYGGRITRLVSLRRRASELSRQLADASRVSRSAGVEGDVELDTLREKVLQRQLVKREMTRALEISGSSALEAMRRLNAISLSRAEEACERLTIVEADSAAAFSAILSSKSADADVQQLVFKRALLDLDDTISDVQLDWLNGYAQALVAHSKQAIVDLEAECRRLQSRLEPHRRSRMVRLRIVSCGEVLAERQLDPASISASASKRMRRSHSP